MTYLLIAIGSAIGGVARHGAGAWIALRFGQTFPWGTLAVNVLGSFAIGVAAALIAAPQRAGNADFVREFLMIGFLGGFTTFSAFSLQTLQLLRDGKVALAAANVVASMLICLIAVAAGYVIAARFSAAAG